MNSIATFFGNMTSRHRRMETFAVSFGILIFGILVVTVISFAMFIQQQNNTLSSKAIYTTDFSTSKTNISGTVVGVYASEDRTKAFILMKFDDVKSISTNANNYQVFMTGINGQKRRETLKSSPAGSVYVFGNSGYMGIYLVNNEGFPTQILDIVVRANAELVKKSDNASNEYANDESFSNYDQFRIYANPGATDATVLKCLSNGNAPTVKDLYNEAVVTNQEAAIRKDLYADLDDMITAQANIKEYTDRLTAQDGVQVPAQPDSINGDSVAKLKDGTYAYDFKSVVPGGYNFEWQNRYVADGYLKGLYEQLGDPTMTSDALFAKMNKEAQLTKSGVDTSIQWRLTDGTLLDDLKSGSNSGRYQQIYADTEGLVTAWQNYYSAKEKYQRTDLGRLLDLEATTDLVVSSSSINTNDNVLRLY